MGYWGNDEGITAWLHDCIVICNLYLYPLINKGASPLVPSNQKSCGCFREVERLRVVKLLIVNFQEGGTWFFIWVKDWWIFFSSSFT